MQIWSAIELAFTLEAYCLAANSILVRVVLGPESQTRFDAFFGVYPQVISNNR